MSTARKQQLKCKRCGEFEGHWLHHQPSRSMHEFAPAVEKTKRLTIECPGLNKQAGVIVATVLLDGVRVLASFVGDTEPEARAAAEKYVSDLLEHFRKGGT